LAGFVLVKGEKETIARLRISYEIVGIVTRVQLEDSGMPRVRGMAPVAIDVSPTL
jgi:hypothetical protein